MVGDVDMDEFSTVVSKYHEAEEQAKGESRDDEEVDGDNLVTVRSQEGAPRRDGRGEGRRMYLATVSSATS